MSNTEGICEHGDLVASCIDCTIAPPAPEAVPALSATHTFQAQFPGVCSECDEPIEAGRRIAAMTDGTYQHTGCVRRWAS